MSKQELAIAWLIVCAERVTRAVGKDAAPEELVPLALKLAQATLGATETLPELSPCVAALQGLVDMAPAERDA